MARKLLPREGRPVTVVAVDDHPTTLAGIRACLEVDDLFQVIAALTSPERLFAPGIPCDVLILDLYLRGDPRDGAAVDFAAVEQLSRRYRTLIYTGAARDEDVFEVMQFTHVAGYLGKEASPERLREAVASVGLGGSVFGAEYAQAFIRERDLRRSFASLVRPTPREAEVLELVAEGLTDQQIADELGIGVATVSHHIKSLRHKLVAPPGNRWGMARRAFEFGFADPPPRRRLFPGGPKR